MADDLRQRIRAALELADDHSCQYGEGSPLDAMADAVLAVRDAELEEAQAAIELFGLWQQRANRERARVQAVRDLHARTEERRSLDLSLAPITTCRGCGEPWPCPTTRAIQGEGS